MPQSPPAQPTTTAAQLRKRHSLGRSRVILAFGFIHYEKGLDTIVEALGQLQRDAADLDARLVVAGTVRRRSAMFKPFEWRDRFHLRNVRRLIRRNGLVDRVEFVGYVPDGEVGPWFDVGDVLVLAYRRVEQSGVGSLARSSQIPIVVSDAGCLAADFSDAGRTFPVGDCVALADRISTVMRAPAGPRAGDPDGSDHQGPSVAEVADRTLSIYQSLLPMEPKPDGVDRHAFADRTRQAFAVTSSS